MTRERDDLATRSGPAPAEWGSGIAGRHLTADLFGVDPERLTDEVGLMRLLLDALGEAGFHVIKTASHGFPGDPGGVTGMVLLSESHAAFHTYPETGYMAVDIFSCGQPEPEVALQILVSALQPSRLESNSLSRG